VNPDVKEKWLTLLRSEEYEQGTAQLGTDSEDGPPKRCCLGVLCEVAVQEGIAEKRVMQDGDVIYGVGLEYLTRGATDDVSGSSTHGEWESAKFYLPKVVREWAGLPHYSPTVPAPDDVSETLYTEGDAVNLSTLNDTVVGYDFHKIADMVERYL
jgi:hypothetical protein